jgi:hypothetical protein
LAITDQIDVVILVECVVEPLQLLLELNRDPRGGFHFCPGLAQRIRIFTRFSADFLVPGFESERISIRRLALPARSEVLLAVAHLPSKTNWSEASQSHECIELARDVVAEEKAGGAPANRAGWRFQRESIRGWNGLGRRPERGQFPSRCRPPDSNRAGTRIRFLLQPYVGPSGGRD